MKKQNAPEKDIFATRWVVFGVVLLSLLMPLGCGVKGDLKRKPAEKTQPTQTNTGRTTVPPTVEVR